MHITLETINSKYFCSLYYCFIYFSLFVFLKVHVLYSSCFPWRRASCACGIAIRSGSSLYIVRTCVEISYRRINLLSVPYEMYSGCDEDELVVQKTYSWYRVGQNHIQIFNTTSLTGENTGSWVGVPLVPDIVQFKYMYMYRE